MECFWDFEGFEVFSKGGFDFFGVEGDVVFCFYEGCGTFSEFGVVDRDDYGLFYLVDVIQGSFDFFGVDVFSATDEHEALSAGDVQVAPFVQRACVAGIEKAFGVQRRFDGVAVYVTFEDGFAFDEDFAVGGDFDLAMS